MSERVPQSSDIDEQGHQEIGRPVEPKYPCKDCGTLRTKAEGGTTFTVCDGCWDKAYPKAPDGAGFVPTAQEIGDVAYAAQFVGGVGLQSFKAAKRLHDLATRMSQYLPKEGAKP